MRRVTRTSLFLCMVGVTSLATTSSRTDEWRAPRHDQGRTGLASGPVNLAAPNIAWRTFMGGQPSHHFVNFVASMSGGPLSNEHAVVQRGGRFIALNMKTQATLWQSEVLGVGWVAGIADLDGDGVEEAVVQTEAQAHVLDGLTGATRWSSSTELVEQMGVTRVRDVDGDGLADVYIDNSLASKWGVDAASAYSFATGGGVKLWAFPVTSDPITVSSGSDGILDLNHDGVAEIILPAHVFVRILSGADGSEVTNFSAPSGWPFQNASSIQTDLDGAGGDELLMVQEWASAAAVVGPSIHAYRVDVDAGTNEFLWSMDTGAYDAEFAATTDVASDLDGDDLSEIIFSYRSPSQGDVWVTKVHAGDTGALLQELPGTRFEGAADLDGLPGKELVVASDAGVSVLTFDASAVVPLAQLGATIPNRRAVTMTDEARRATTWLDQRLALLPRPGKSPLLIVGELPGDFTLSRASSFASLEGYELVDGAWQVTASYEPLLGTIVGLLEADFSTRPYPQIAVGVSTGIVDVLNQFMEVTNGLTWVDGTRLGAFVGGSYARGNPLVASDSEGPFVVLPGTAIGTVVADARTASWIIPPLPRWWNERLSNTSILDVAGSTRVVGVANGSIVAHHSVGGTSTPPIAMPYGFPWGTPVSLQAGSETLVGIDWRNYAGEIFQTAVDLQTGATVFTGAPILTGGFFGSSVGDLDGNGTDEWYSMTFASLWQRDASTGQVVALGSFPDMNYALPMVTTNMSGDQSLLLQAGYDGPALVSDNGTVQWQADLLEPVNGMGGVVLTCGSTKRYVTPGVLSASLSFYDVATGAIVGSRTYAGGTSYADADAALADGSKPGVLSHVNGVASLDGAPAALAGSSDGHVYVIDPCSMDVRWAADLGASAGEPVIADVDADGADEILVAAADGFLYGLDDFSFPAPFITLAGQGANPTLELGVGAGVTVSWDAIDGAASYEVALIGPDDKPVWTPTYQAAEGTSFDVDLVGALASRPYRLAVRVGGADPGREALSSPFIIKDVTPPTLTATPTGGSTSTLAFEAADDLALDVGFVSVSESGGESLVVAEAFLKGPAEVANLTWKAPTSLLGKAVIVEASVRDSAGLVATRSFEASVGEDGVIAYDSDEPIDEPIDEPNDTDETTDTDDEEKVFLTPQGCACSVPERESNGALALLALSLAVLAVGRKRGRRSRA